jgi:hypothetical protein
MESAVGLVGKWVASLENVSWVADADKRSLRKLIEARDAATEAKVREEYAGLVERAYREGWMNSYRGRNMDPDVAWENSDAKAALEGKVSQ